MDAPGLPIGPVEPIVEKRYGKRVVQVASDQFAPIMAVIVHHGDEPQSTVRPVNELIFIVNRQAVRPEYVVGDDDLARTRVTVHRGALNLRHFAPVGPEEKSLHRRQGNRARLIDVRPEEHLPVTAVDAGHLDPILLAVRPVQFVCKPVAGKTIGRYQTGVDNCYSLAGMRAVVAHALYHLQTAVGPANQPALIEEVQRRAFRQVFDDDVDLIAARHVGHPDVLVSGEEKKR